MESSQNPFTQFQMTSTPKYKAMDKLPHLHRITDNTYIPFSVTDKTSDARKNDRLYLDESHHTTTYNKSPEVPFMGSKKHLGSEMSFVPSSNTALSVKVDKRPKSSLPYTSYQIPESKDSLVSFKGQDDELFNGQMLHISELKGEPSHAEETESQPLQITDVSLRLKESSMSTTSDSQHIDHSVDFPKAEVSSLHQSNALLHTREGRIRKNSLDWSTTNTDHPKQVIPLTDCQRAASEKKEEINTLKNGNCNLQKQLKNVDSRDVAKLKDDDFVFKIQELESYLTESDQLHMQEQRLKSKTVGIQMALKQLQINEQCLKDDNFHYREQISRLKTEKNFLQLRLSRAEQDGEEYVHEINTITDKCEELLNQRKQFQDERNRISVEKQFLAKEIEDFNREKKINCEQLALITAERDKLVNMVNSMKTMVFTYAKEKQELQSRLKEILVENTNLRRKMNTHTTEQQKIDNSRESWSNEETSDRHKLSTLEVTPLSSTTEKLKPRYGRLS
ncbi:coiled-coil domain-containing protein 110 isoform 2-T3 [Anomaloglossus baeobatrachus]